MNLLIILLFIFASYLQTWASTCSVPPFLTTSVSPNVLFVVDKSGSMSWAAYYKTWSSTSDPADIGQYNPDKVYEGYFIPDKLYELKNGVWVESSSTTESCTMYLVTSYQGLGGTYEYYNYYSISGICLGNRLNFARMSRMDLLRWSVTGGKPEVCPDNDFTNPNCDPNLACTGSTCRLITTGLYNGYWDFTRDIVEVPTWRIRGIVQELEAEGARPRLGVLFFSDGIEPEKVYIGDYPYTGSGNPGNADPDHPYTYFKRFINAMPPGGGTGTAVALWEAYDYFKQSNDHNYSNGFSLATSGSLYKDPIYVCDYDKSNCQPAPCAKNFVILASDGQWNYGGNPAAFRCSIDDDGYENYSVDPVVPAYRMHTETLRTITTLGESYDINISAVYALGLFLGGTGERSLQNVAMYGSFDTSQGTWPGGTSGSLWNGSGAEYPWLTCDMDVCGPGWGIGCTPLPSDPNDDGVIDTVYPDWDKDGDGIPDTFLNAKNAIEIKKSLLSFIRDILKRTSAASSVSILSRRGTAGNNVIQAVFYPQKPFPNGNRVDWVGYLYNYWFYYSSTEQSIREDTNKNRILDLDKDYKLDFVVDSAGNLKIDAYDNNNNLVTTYNSLDEVNPIWEAGEILKNTDPADRKIYTVDSTGTLVEFGIANKSSFQSYLGNISNFPTCLSSSGNSVDNLINFVRGEHIDGCRDRRVDSAGNTWKLGDIVYSTPAILDYGSYGMVFVGANDGMLHAFRIGALRTDNLTTNQVVRLCDQLTGNCTDLEIGGEEWAFIPRNALPYLRDLADPDYVHDYIVDLQPYIIRLDTNDDGFPDKVVLVGGMRLGGGCGCTDATCDNPPGDVCNLINNPAGCEGLSSYFALDITDPQNPVFLWEFTHPDLGFSFSGPAHIKVGEDHFVMFVSGPTNKCGNSVQELKVFVLKLNPQFKIASKYIFYGNSAPSVVTGYTTVKSSTLASFNNSFGGRLFTEGIDYDEDGDTDMVFFGVNKKSGGVWQGNIIGVRINSKDPASWEFIKVFNSDIEPITAKVEHMKCFGMNYIFFGTGRWFFKNDEPGQNNQDTEKLYGVRVDGCLSGGNCNINQAKNSSEACQELQSGGDVFAWKIELDPCVSSGTSNTCDNADYFKERLISDPAVTSFDTVFFATTQPTGKLCGFGGRSRLWGLNCATGDAFSSTACPGFIAEVPAETTVLLQLSRGNIEQIGTSGFTQEGNRATEFLPGTTPESPPTVPGGGSVEGKIILWMER